MTEQRFGGFWRRALAFFVDKIILFFVNLLVLFVGIFALWLGYSSSYSERFPEDILGSTISFTIIYGLVVVLIHMLYFTYFHGTTGQTPGKMMLGLRVVRSTGEEMSLGIGFLRWVGYIVSTVFLWLGFVWIAFDGKKQGWHDKVAQTFVIRVERVAKDSLYPPGEKYLDKDREIL